MKFQLASDLHGANDVYHGVHGGDKDTILLLPGDIHEVKRKTAYREMIGDYCSRFKQVILVPGNHEYYGSNIHKTHQKLDEISIDFPNFWAYTNNIDHEPFLCEQDGQYYLIVGGTLWTDFDAGNPLTKFDARTKMNDYKHIRHGSPSEPWKRKFTPDDAEFFHFEMKKYLKEQIEKYRQSHYNLKVIVMSHHAPSFGSVSPEYISDDMNGCYCSNLDYYIMDLNPDVWVHGHVHSSHDYMIDSTRILCNPRGYGSTYPENRDYNPEFIFEV